MSIIYLAVILVSAHGAGFWLLRFGRLDAPLGNDGAARWLRLVCRLATGLGAMSLAALALASAGLFPRPVVHATLLALACVGAATLRRCDLPRWQDLPAGWLPRSLLLLLTGTWLLHVWLAWNPMLLIDSWAYHITMPKQFLLQGRVFETPYELHPNFHFLHEFLIYWGLAIASDDFILAKLLQVVYTGLLAILIVAESARRFAAIPGIIAALFLLLSPDFIEFSPSAHLDVSLAFYLLGAFLLLARALESAPSDAARLAVLAGLFMGFAIGTKTSGYVYLPLTGGLFAALQFLRPCQRAWHGRLRVAARLSCIYACVSLLLALPWAIKNVLITGNPLYPFALGILGARQEYLQVAVDFHRSYGNYTEAMPLSLEWFHTLWVQFTYRAGTILVVEQWQAMMLFLVAALLWLRPTPGRQRLAGEWFLVLAGLALVPVVLLSPARRFVFGPMVLHALLGVGILARVATPLLRARIAAIALSVVLLLFFARLALRGAAVIYPNYVPRGPIPAGTFLTTGQMHRQYFERRPDWPLVEYLETQLPPDSRVLTTENIYANAVADVPILIALNIHGKRILRLMMEDEGRTAEQARARLGELRITHLFTTDRLAGHPEVVRFREAYLHPIREFPEGTLYEVR